MTDSNLGAAPATRSPRYLDIEGQMILDRVHAHLFDGDRGGEGVTTPQEGSEPGELLLGAHRVLRRLGSGGMGEVYLAFNARLERLEALKVLRASEGQDPRARARLRGEAQALARLSHPNVVHVYSADESADGTVYLAMEFIEGRTLETWQHKRAQTWREVVEVYVAAGRGIAAAHKAGLVHRDIKPSNVLIAEGEGPVSGRVKVIDFGLAIVGGKVKADGAAIAPVDLRRTNGVVGTPYYLAPEQCMPVPALTPRSDQFSFCVALYEALYDQHPFGPGGDMSTRSTEGGSHPQPATNPPPFAALAQAICTAPLREPPAKTPVPRSVFRILARGLDRTPEARHESLAELLQLLESELRPRTRSGWLLTAAAGLTLGAASIAYWKTGEPAMCRDPGAELDVLWNNDRVGAIQTAFANSSSKELADSSLRVVAAALDAYTEQWEVVARTACVDTYSTGKLDRSAYNDRMACLASRKTALGQAVDLLSRSPEALGRIDAILAGLPPIEDCAALVAPRCGDPAAVAEIAGLGAELDAARAAELDARYLEAANRAERARVLVEGRPALLAEVELLRGRALGELARFHEADEALRTAYFAADQAGCDGLAVDTASRLTKVLALDVEPTRLVTNWWQFALTKLEQMPLDRTDPSQDALYNRRKAEILNNRGLLRARKLKEPRCEADGEMNCGNDLAGAEEDLREALRLYGLVAGPTELDRSNTHRNLGAVLFESGRIDEAFAQFEEGLALVEGALGREHPASWKAHFDLGKASVDAGREAQAGEHLLVALELVSLALDPRNVKVGEVHLELSKYYDNVGDIRAARNHADEAVAIFRERGLSPSHPSYFNALRMSGYLAQALGDYEAALVIRRKLLDVVSGANLAELLWSHGELAETLLAQRQWAPALKHARLASTLADILARPPHDTLRGEMRLFEGLALAGVRDGQAVAVLKEAQTILSKNQVIDPASWAHATWALTQATCVEVPRNLSAMLADPPALHGEVLRRLAAEVTTYDRKTCTPLSTP